MSVLLSDRDIRTCIGVGDIEISPAPWDSCIQPASVDLRLGPTFRVFRNHREGYIDPQEKQELTEPFTTDRFFMLHPGEFVLAATEESVNLRAEQTMFHGLAARVEGKSSLGRLGLLVHSTAGFIDPGFRGNITLELANIARLPIRLTPGMRICQISFLALSSPPQRYYGDPTLRSHYQDSKGVVPSRVGEE